MRLFTSIYDEKEYFDSIDYLYNLIEGKNTEFITNLIFIQLVISLEVFIERLSKPLKKEYKNFCMNTLPSRIKIEHCKEIIKSLNDKLYSSIEAHKKDCETLFLDLSKIWSDKSRTHKVKLNFDLKFRSGKHGDAEIIKIFEKLGINNIFKEMKIKNKEGSLIYMDEFIDAQLFIQELVEKRNLAIHQGVKLSSQFSVKEVGSKIYVLKEILKEINKILDKHLNGLYFKKALMNLSNIQPSISNNKYFSNACYACI